MYDNFDTNSDCDICLYTLPSPGGSGKTYTIAREAHRLALQGQRVLIAQPTIDLIEKTLADEIEVLFPQVDCKAIHSQRSDNVLRDVKYRLMKKDDDLGPKGQITLIKSQRPRNASSTISLKHTGYLPTTLMLSRRVRFTGGVTPVTKIVWSRSREIKLRTIYPSQ